MNKSTPINRLPSNLPMMSSNNDEELMIKNALQEIDEEDVLQDGPSSEDKIRELQRQLDSRERTIYETKYKDQLNEEYVDNDKDIIDSIGLQNSARDIPISDVPTIQNMPLHFIKEFQPTIFVVLIFFVVSIIPIEKMIYKYVSLNKIPYSDMIIKAILAGSIFFVLTKL